MNNEPVAFWNKDFDLWEKYAIQTYKAYGWNIPLYTHPANLTDEEIWELAHPYGDLAWQDCTLEFARAILLKAQE